MGRPARSAADGGPFRPGRTQLIGHESQREKVMSGKVQCVPGGHQVSIDKAYWCDRCRQYLCYDRAWPSYLVNTVKCPKGDIVVR
jgi:threonine dehydrogenase-like Zn-dependent dehydrogenase